MLVGFKMECKLKSDFVPVINSLFDLKGSWQDLARKYPDYEFLELYAKFPNSDMIPFSNIDTEPYWGKTGLVDKLFLHYKTQTWKFEVVVKKRLVWAFMMNILNNVAESVLVCQLKQDEDLINIRVENNNGI